MKAKDFSLEKNQLWKLTDRHLKIMSVGRFLTHFKHYLSVDQKRVPTQLGTIVAVQAYLKKNRGKLITEDHPLNRLSLVEANGNGKAARSTASK